MLELRHEPESQRQAFADACAWAEEIDLCLAWLEPGDAHGPSFADLEPHQRKVRQAIVGLAHFQSYPALLRRLYRSSVLKLVSTLDGSFSPNCYLFRNGARWRVLVASAPFTSTRFARPCESLVVYEGDRDDPFVLRALQLLERCRAAAHVPTSNELDTYEAAWADARTGGPTPEFLPGLALETFDTSSLGELTLLSEAAGVLEAFVEVRDSMSRAATLRVPARLLRSRAQPRDEALDATLYWSSLGIWGALLRRGPELGLHFGFQPPWQVERPAAALSLIAATRPRSLGQLAAEGASDVMTVARAEDGRRFLAHLSAGAEDYTTDIVVRDGSGTAPAALIGEVGTPDFLQTAAAFAFRVTKRRAHRESETSS